MVCEMRAPLAIRNRSNVLPGEVECEGTYGYQQRPFRCDAALTAATARAKARARRPDSRGARMAERYKEDDRIAGTEYKFIRRIGSGGMGEVYEVEHIRTGGRFAMKLLIPRRSKALATRRMEFEARVLGKLTNLTENHVVRVLYAGTTAETEERFYFVTDLLKGLTLGDVIRDRGREHRARVGKCHCKRRCGEPLRRERRRTWRQWRRWPDRADGRDRRPNVCVGMQRR